MESKRGNHSYQAFPMKGGDGEYSYAQNSTRQRRGADLTKNIIKEAILEKLDLEKLLQHSSDFFRIADLGCSVGPNTFFTVQNVIEAVNLKSQSQGYGLDNFEFQVFFNDHVGNDFNTLFRSLPEDKQYYAAAVPGSFHGRLFPKSSIHFFNSSYSLHWLSRVPKDIVDKNLPAYNKGRIYFTNAAKEVADAYSAQFARDMESFLNSRALELVSGGIMTLIIPCVPLSSINRFQGLANIMGNVLGEMVNKGLISDELVDSFNLPIYMPAPEELKGLIENNGNFKLEKSESLFRLFTNMQQQDVHGLFTNMQQQDVHGLFTNMQQQDVHGYCMYIRAALEGPFMEHFGGELVDEIFIQFEKKLGESTFLTDPTYKPTLGELFVLKRNFV